MDSMLTNPSNPRGLAINVESPYVVWASIVGALVAAVLHPIFMPNSEQATVGNKAKHTKKLVIGYVVLIAGAAMLGIHGYLLKDETAKRIQQNPYHAQIGDFPIALFSFTILTISRILLTPLFARAGARFIPKGKYSEVEWSARVERFAGQFWKLLFHGTMTIIPLVILRNQTWFPPGFEDRQKAWEDYPLTKPTPWLREYYLFQLGYYLHAMQLTLIQSSRANFVSMVVHHIATISLVVSSYLWIHVLRFGTQIFWLHDATDVPVCLTRLVVDLPWMALTASSYFLLMVGWIGLRIVIYPFDCVKAHVYDAIAQGWVKSEDAKGWWLAQSLEVVLVVMHWMWLGELAGMARTYLKSGKSADSTQEHSKKH